MEVSIKAQGKLKGRQVFRQEGGKFAGVEWRQAGSGMVCRCGEQTVLIGRCLGRKHQAAWSSSIPNQEPGSKKEESSVCPN